MSYPDHPQQPQWQPPQQPGQPGQGFPPQQAPGQPGFAPPQGPGQPYQGGPGAPMGPGPGGPGGPGQPPYGGPPQGGQYSGGPMPPPGGGGGRKWLIPAAAGVAVTVMAGTVWATVSLVSFDGTQPESVLPGNSVAFGKVDLDIDGSQAIDLLSFVDQLPDEVTEETSESGDDPTALFAEVFADAYDLDQAGVEAWIGPKVGLSAWHTNNSEAADHAGMGNAIALAVEDAGAADTQFAGLRESHDVHHEMVDDFVVFSDSEAALGDYNDQMASHGTLADDSTYNSDAGDVPSGSIALAWADMGSLSGMTDVGNEFTGGLGSDADLVEGRMTASVRVDGDYLEARADVFGFEVEDEDLSWLADAQGASVAAMAELPSDTVMALGGSGLDEALSTAWEEDDLPFLTADVRRDMETDLNAIGAPLPEGFTSLLGTSTAFGLSEVDPGGDPLGNSYGPGGDPAFEYRAVGGDESALNGFVEDIVVGPYSTTDPPGVTSDGDTVVVSQGGNPTGGLGEDAVFQQAMQDLDDAVMAGFFDLRQILDTGDVDVPDQWGAVGVGMSVTDGGERATFELRWAPSGA
ncbi:hypothetical protein [Nocardiopsis nanhaiensis]